MSLVIRVAAVLLPFLIARPWRLPAGAKLWGSAALLNALVFVTLPQTAATSPLRPVVDGVAMANVVLSVLLTVGGLMLWWSQRAGPDGRYERTVYLLAAALPAFFGLLFWVVGPFY